MKVAPKPSASKEAKKSGEWIRAIATAPLVPYVVSPASVETIRKVLNITRRDSKVARQALKELGLSAKQRSNR